MRRIGASRCEGRRRGGSCSHAEAEPPARGRPSNEVVAPREAELRGPFRCPSDGSSVAASLPCGERSPTAISMPCPWPRTCGSPSTATTRWRSSCGPPGELRDWLRALPALPGPALRGHGRRRRRPAVGAADGDPIRRRAERADALLRHPAHARPLGADRRGAGPARHAGRRAADGGGGGAMTRLIGQLVGPSRAPGR